MGKGVRGRVRSVGTSVPERTGYRGRRDYEEGV